MKQHNQSLNAQEILELIFQYLTQLSSLRDYDEVLEVLANMGRALTSADRCSVWIVSDDRKTIWTKVAHGIDPIKLPIDSGIVGHCILTGEKVIINDVYQDDRFNSKIDKITGYKTKSMMVVPMFDNENVIIGAFQVINHLSTKGVFDKRDLERLLLATTYAAETLISAKLTQEIQDTQKEVIFTMGAIGESRSKETGNHVKRVAEYSKILALAVGLDEAEAELLKQASPMHDIGKVAIPDEILKKPGRFTQSERKIMELHAQLGYEMIKDSKRPLLKAAAIVAHQHHERWDGKGYPRGLKEEEIHIYGRITALADVFDALGSDRVYKKAWEDEKIFQLIKKERAKQFDPFIVDKFFEHIDEILAVREKYKDKFQKEASQQKDFSSIQVLGAYGTKLKGFGTTSFLLDKHHVIDAGNLINTLEEQSVNIQTIWLSHSHLDHIIDIAYILDNYYNVLKHPIIIAGLKETLKAVEENFLNNSLWPDFSKIPLPNQNKPCIIYKEIQLNQTYQLSDTKTLQPIKADHTVTCCGYIYKEKERSLLISSDTYDISNMIQYINKDKTIKSAIFECSFPNRLEELARVSKHLTPNLLFKQLKTIQRDDVTIYINHIKPIYLDEITQEIELLQSKIDLKILKDKEILHF